MESAETIMVAPAASQMSSGQKWFQWAKLFEEECDGLKKVLIVSEIRHGSFPVAPPR
jgi:hypothetical protein